MSAERTRRYTLAQIADITRSGGDGGIYYVGSKPSQKEISVFTAKLKGVLIGKSVDIEFASGDDECFVFVIISLLSAKPKSKAKENPVSSEIFND